MTLILSMLKCTPKSAQIPFLSECVFYFLNSHPEKLRTPHTQCDLLASSSDATASLKELVCFSHDGFLGEGILYHQIQATQYASVE